MCIQSGDLVKILTLLNPDKLNQEVMTLYEENCNLKRAVYKQHYTTLHHSTLHARALTLAHIHTHTTNVQTHTYTHAQHAHARTRTEIHTQ